MHPEAVDLLWFVDKATFEFRDKHYARWFALLNKEKLSREESEELAALEEAGDGLSTVPIKEPIFWE